MADALPAGATPVEPIAAAEIRPRFELYVTGEDHLRILAVNSLAGVVLTIAGRAWDPVNGVIVPIGRTMAPPADRTAAEITIPLAAGFLLDLTVFASTGSPLSGQTYVMAQLVRGLTANAPQLATLTADYVTSLQCLCWPGSSPKSSTEGEPYVRAIVGTAPAAGAEIHETVPTGARWSLVSVLVGLSTSGVGPDRRVIWQHRSGAFARAEAITSAGVPLATGANITFAAGLTPLQDLTGVHFTSGWVTDNRMLAGDVMLTTTSNLAAADQFTAPFFVVREWLEVP